MSFTLSQNIGFVRCFRSVKQTKTNGFVVDLYFCQPLAVFAAHAWKSAFVAARRFVPRIFHVANCAQITPPVVRAVTVNVVNLFGRPLSDHVQPRQPVRQMQRIINADDNVTVTHFAPSFVAQTAPAARLSPSKLACFGAIMHQRFKSFCRQIHTNLLNTTVNINLAVCKGQA